MIDKNAFVISLMMSNSDMVNALAKYSARYETDPLHKKRRELSEACRWMDDMISKHLNFNGANVYRIRGGLWRICGHHPGEAYDSYKILKQL